MISWISRGILRLWGMRVEGNTGKTLPKKIFAVVPHTSKWDFPLGILVRSAHQMKVNFVGKKSLFKPPLGWLMRWLGGYPIDRSQRQNRVEFLASVFRSEKEFALAIAPEGTRQKVDKLRTGFYHIARLAGVPIILIRFDFGRKMVTFSEPFHPTEDQEADFAYIHAYFKGIKGFNPELSFDPPAKSETK